MNFLEVLNTEKQKSLVKRWFIKLPEHYVFTHYFLLTEVDWSKAMRLKSYRVRSGTIGAVTTHICLVTLRKWTWRPSTLVRNATPRIHLSPWWEKVRQSFIGIFKGACPFEIIYCLIYCCTRIGKSSVLDYKWNYLSKCIGITLGIWRKRL